MIGYEKTNAINLFYGDPWNGGKYESKKTLLYFISYPEQRKAP